MTSSVQEAREAFGLRLREIRRNSGVSGRELAAHLHVHESKISRIEHGKATPSAAVLRAYCQICNANGELPELLATLNHLQTMYMEWRKLLGSGVKRGQQLVMKNESSAELIRNYESQIIPGLLQTAAYAEAKLRRVIEFYHLPDDLDAGVIARMERQQILYKRGRRFHFIISEKSLYTTVGDDSVMTGQLDRLLSIIGMPNLTLGIVPLTAEALVVIEAFMMFDTRVVKVEGHTAELSITQPREIAEYGRAFDTLAGQSVTGDAARTLIRRALTVRTEAAE
ncbi:helix-turn-helix domain-containing protein [Nocardia jiangxiensis]|uniref:helix-turn-helix domain-containing protein n=1 Tax=Nocardia jiangxiensis TaxID=282685 RepID=UPI0006886B3C|nr:helix-turn-helix transcriptional regulator [Nocardia jiangxiensis]